MFRVFALAVLALLAPLEGGGVMFAAKQIFLGRCAKAAPTANSYTQDGLIAMWDGIENAGWGTHDAAAKTWKDLVGGDWGPWDIQGTGENYAIFTNAQQVKTFGSPKTVPATIEMSIFDHNFSGGCFFNIGNIANWSALAGSGMLCPYDYPPSRKFQFYSKRTAVDVAYPENNSTFSIKYTTSSVTVYENGQLKSTANIANSVSYNSYAIGKYTNVGVSCKAFFLRLYSRALTAEEIAANYAIDKERFNLP